MVAPPTSGPYGKDFRSSQISFSNDGVVLTVDRNGTSPNILSGQLQSIAENILFGSFRIQMRLPTQTGTCSALFYYLDDTQEIDMEFLGSFAGDGRAHSFYGTQTGDFNQLTNALAWANFPYVASQTSDFQEYRFDWSTRGVNYYYNGGLLHTATMGVPQNPGLILMNHWSTGAPGWEMGPPTGPVDLVIKKFTSYFNTTYDPKSCTAKSKPACLI